MGYLQYFGPQVFKVLDISTLSVKHMSVCLLLGEHNGLLHGEPRS